jgi:hypothetical protein
VVLLLLLLLLLLCASSVRDSGPLYCRRFLKLLFEKAAGSDRSNTKKEKKKVRIDIQLLTLIQVF